VEQQLEQQVEVSEWPHLDRGPTQQCVAVLGDGLVEGEFEHPPGLL
jgi:hypothetical protein